MTRKKTRDKKEQQVNDREAPASSLKQEPLHMRERELAIIDKHHAKGQSMANGLRHGRIS